MLYRQNRKNKHPVRPLSGGFLCAIKPDKNRKSFWTFLCPLNRQNKQQAHKTQGNLTGQKSGNAAKNQSGGFRCPDLSLTLPKKQHTRTREQ